MNIEQEIKKFEHLFQKDGNNLILNPTQGIPPIKLIYVEGGILKPYDIKLSSFYMAQFTVTQELYQAVVGKNPDNFQGVNRPVEQVTWYDAVEFCRVLNEKLKINPNPIIKKSDKDYQRQIGALGFRLPTDAEWEYAARGGKYADDFKFAGSNNLDDVGWYKENNYEETKSVGLKFPNRLCIYDLSGNLRHWCWDLFDNDFLKHNKGKENPVCEKSKEDFRLLRGGSWYNNADISRVAYRNYDQPAFRNYGFGFCLVFGLQFTTTEHSRQEKKKQE